MQDIINYKLKDFLNKEASIIESYSRLLKHLDPIPTKNKLQNLSLRQVETIKQGLNDPEALPEMFEYIEGISIDKFEDLRIIEFYGLLNDIVKQIENLVGMEEQELVSTHTDYKWEAVEGSERLAVMGILPMINDLANNDILKYELILDLPYLTVFNRLRMDRIRGDIEKDMQKIKTNKEE